MKIAEKITLRLEGRKAHVEGKPASSCPYDADKAVHRDNWLHGWWHRAYEHSAPEGWRPPYYVPAQLI